MRVNILDSRGGAGLALETIFTVSTIVPVRGQCIIGELGAYSVEDVEIDLRKPNQLNIWAMPLPKNHR